MLQRCSSLLSMGGRERGIRMTNRDRYRDHVDPEYRRWRRKYRRFPGVAECVRLIRDRKATRAWADIVAFELADNAIDHLNELIRAFRDHESDEVGLFVLMALEMAALPASVEFLSSVLRDGNVRFVPQARRALQAIDTRESRVALLNASEAVEECRRFRSVTEAGSDDHRLRP